MRAPAPPRATPRRRGVALAGGLAAAALLLAAADLWLLPRLLPLPRETWLMGFAAEPPQVDDVRISALGFAGDALAAREAPGTLRVLTLGGSALFNRDFTERLRANLAPLVPGRLEIVGGALRAHTSRSSLLKWRLLARHEFDVVVIYEGINDLYANHVSPDLYRDDYAHLGAWYVRHPLLDHSVIARLVYDAWLHRPVEGEAMASGFRSIGSLHANLRELVAATRAAGAEPVLSTFAWAIPSGYDREAFERGDAGYANPERYDPRPVEFWGPLPWVREGLVRTNVAIHEVARETGAPLFDAERILGRDLRWFGDVCHPSVAGVERLAGALAAFLHERRLLAPRDSEAQRRTSPAH